MNKRIIIFTFLLFLTLLLVGCSKKTFLVTFVDYDDTIISEAEVVEGEAATAPENPTREGYTFLGWDVNFSNITAPTIVKATYEAIQLTVSFCDYNGTELKSEVIGHHGSATAPADPTRVGYTFTGWSTPFNDVTTDLTITAVYAINHYTVSFYDEETLLKEESVEYLASATAPNSPAKEGYTFINWSTDFSQITDNLTVQALYEINNYVVTFKDGDQILEVQSIDYNMAATAPSNPSKIGYEFTGWDKDFSTITDSIIVNAVFSPLTYTLTYHANNQNSVISATQWTTKEIFVTDFYTDYFEWLSNQVGKIAELTLNGSTYTLSKNGSTATWSDVASLKLIDKYVFEKTLSNYIYAPIIRPASDNNPQIPVVNSGYFLNTEPYRSKFIELDGYFLKALITSYSGYDRSYTPTSAGKIQIFFRFQQWVQGTSIVGFTYFGDFKRYDVTSFGSVVLPTNQTFTIEDELTIPNPTYQDVTFLGWYKTDTGIGNPITTLNHQSGNLDLFACWDTDATQNHFQYYDMDGTLLKEETLPNGAALTPPTVSAKEGYVFQGWDKSLVNVTTNCSFTATYSKIEYTLTYNDNTDQLEIPVPNSFVYHADDDIILEEITYDGYYFLGWYQEAACLNEITHTTTGTMTVYAKWVKVPTGSEIIGDGSIMALIDDDTISVGTSANVYATNDQTYLASSSLKYASSDEAIATVSRDGFVLGLAPGTVTILVVSPTQMATVELTVEAIPQPIRWVGHQGAGGPFVQNTVDAFVAGAQRGYYALECDVRVSKDGVYYICHDDTFLEYLFVDTTLHGKLMGGYNWTDLSTYQIKDTYGGQTYYSTLSTVEQYLNVCKQYGVKAILELKYTNGINSSDTSRLGGLIELVKSCDMYENAIFMTSMTSCLLYLRSNYPDVQLQFLSGSSSTTLATTTWCIEHRISLDAPNNLVTKEIVDAIHSAGLYVNAYTVDSQSVATTLMELGVDMITTNSLGQ